MNSIKIFYTKIFIFCFLYSHSQQISFPPLTGNDICDLSWKFDVKNTRYVTSDSSLSISKWGNNQKSNGNDSSYFKARNKLVIAPFDIDSATLIVEYYCKSDHGISLNFMGKDKTLKPIFLKNYKLDPSPSWKTGMISLDLKDIVLLECELNFKSVLTPSDTIRIKNITLQLPNTVVRKSLPVIKHYSIDTSVNGNASGFPRIDKSVKIIGVGEVHHGSKTIDVFKYTFCKELILSQRVRGIALEIPYDVGHLLDLYIQNKIPDIKEIEIYLNTFLNDKEDLKSFLYWLRDYNLKNKEKVLITGIDLFTPIPLHSLLMKEHAITYFGGDSKIVGLIHNKKWENLNNEITDVFKRSNGFNKTLQSNDVENLYQKSLEYLSFQKQIVAQRDSSMNEEVLRLLKSVSNGSNDNRVIVFAHSTHLEKSLLYLGIEIWVNILMLSLGINISVLLSPLVKDQYFRISVLIRPYSYKKLLS